MARLMLSAGMFSDFAARIAVRRRGFMSGSPPDFAAIAISLMRRVKILPRLESSAPFLCLIVAHFEWPDIALPRVVSIKLERELRWFSECCFSELRIRPRRKSQDQPRRKNSQATKKYSMGRRSLPPPPHSRSDRPGCRAQCRSIRWRSLSVIFPLVFLLETIGKAPSLQVLRSLSSAETVALAQRSW